MRLLLAFVATAHAGYVAKVTYFTGATKAAEYCKSSAGVPKSLDDISALFEATPACTSTGSWGSLKLTGDACQMSVEMEGSCLGCPPGTDSYLLECVSTGETSPPSPPPPGEDDDDDKVETAPCFGRDTTYATRPDGERVLMSTLKAGDLVKDGPSSVARVIVNQHRTDPVASTLLTLEHTKGSLSLTPDHVLEIDGRMAAAREATIGSKLSDAEVLRVATSMGAVINPITSSGRIVANGVVAAVYPEWIADYMLTSVLPLPFSIGNLLSYLFPEKTQAYYDGYLEPLFPASGPSYRKYLEAVPSLLLAPAFVVGDLTVTAGFVAFSVASNIEAALVGLAAVALAVKAARKA